MKIRLGRTQVTAKSDGGLSLYPSSSSCHYPVLCIEVVPPYPNPSIKYLGKTKETSPA
jgi:hypothetical protein